MSDVIVSAGGVGVACNPPTVATRVRIPAGAGKFLLQISSLLQWVPGLSKILLPRLHPISLLGLSSAVVSVFVDFVINAYGYYAADSLGAIIIAIMMFGTMMPMSIYR